MIVVFRLISGSLTLSLELPEPSSRVLDIFQLLSVSRKIFVFEGVARRCEKVLYTLLGLTLVTRMKTNDIILLVVFNWRDIFLIIERALNWLKS
jgi:hypothetical protein